jgi:hypothetical protein
VPRAIALSGTSSSFGITSRRNHARSWPALLSESGEANGATRALLDDMDKVRKSLILNHSCGGSEQSVDRRAGDG